MRASSLSLKELDLSANLTLFDDIADSLGSKLIRRRPKSIQNMRRRRSVVSFTSCIPSWETYHWKSRVTLVFAFALASLVKAALKVNGGQSPHRCTILAEPFLACPRLRLTLCLFA